MSFKFKLGEIVQKIEEPGQDLYRVIGLLLEGRINVRSLKTHSARIVSSEEYERIDIPIEEYDY